MLSEFDIFEEWFAFQKSTTDPKMLPEPFVLATTFLGIRESDKELVGMINIRHYLNAHLLNSGGNIGYGVRPSQRKKGYVSQMLAQALAYLKDIGNTKALLTCLSENEASRHTIKKFGGVFENTYEDEDGLLERYWIML